MPYPLWKFLESEKNSDEEFHFFQYLKNHPQETIEVFLKSKFGLNPFPKPNFQNSNELRKFLDELGFWNWRKIGSIYFFFFVIVALGFFYFEFF